MNDYLSEVFGDGGLFASRFPGYEMREGQVALARMVDEAMRGGRHALGEGPCGTGKSVAYAVPAVHHAHHEKKRVVIATANIALQEQLVRKDLPMLASVLPWPFTFALLKGRNNYVCLDRMAESEARGELRGLYDDDQQRQVDDVLAWAEATKTGDVSELPFIPHAAGLVALLRRLRRVQGRRLPVPRRLLRRAREGDGAGRGHRRHELPHALRAPRRAQATGQDLVLPAFDLLVLDEAHEAAEIAREFFGFTLSEHTFGRLASAAADLGNKQLAGELRQEAQRLFATLADFARSPRYKKRLKAPGFANDAGLQRALGKLVALATARAEDELADKKERATARNVAKNATVAGRAPRPRGSRSRTRPASTGSTSTTRGAPSSGRSPST
jgi:ATP-dependent DNA helicase DinG